MWRRVSLNVLLISLIAIPAACLTVTFALMAHGASQQRAAADRVVAIASLTKDLFTALQRVRVERGTVNGALTASATVDDATKANLMALRAASTSAVARGLAAADGVDLPPKAKLLDDVRAAER